MEDILTLIQVFFWIALILGFIVGFNIWNAGNDLKNQNLKTSGMIIMMLMIASIIFYFVIKSKTNSESATENASPNIETQPADKPIEEAPPPPQPETAASEPELSSTSNLSRTDGRSECGTFTITHYPNERNECEGDGCECIDYK